MDTFTWARYVMNITSKTVNITVFWYGFIEKDVRFEHYFVFILFNHITKHRIEQFLHKNTKNVFFQIAADIKTIHLKISLSSRSITVIPMRRYK